MPFSGKPAMFKTEFYAYIWKKKKALHLSMNKTYYPTTMSLAMLFKSVYYCMSAASSYAVAATFDDEHKANVSIFP